MLTDADIARQGKPEMTWLRFTPDVESVYVRSRLHQLWDRAWLVSLAGLVGFLVYAWLDILFLPEPVSRWSVPIRLFVIVPVILVAVLWRGWGQPSRAFAWYYAFTYLWGGLGIVALIAISRYIGHPMPYDGLLLVLMFGYFVMGMPFRVSFLISTLLIVTYLASDWWLGLDRAEWAFNCFFLWTSNLIGMVGAWLHEAGLRRHFLDRCRLELSSSRAEEESQEKSRFLAVASHDLRQPLHVINLLLENLQWQENPQQRDKTIGQLRSTADHLNRLLGSLLDISRLNEGLVKPDLQPVEVIPLVSQVAVELTEVGRQKGVEVEVEVPPVPLRVNADPVLLERILRNLLSNALEHSGGHHVRLSTRVDDTKCEFRVEDDGRGIPPSIREQVFSEFFQVDRGGHPFRGLGLGLAIVRQLSRLMGGDCGVQGTKLGGAMFWVALPLLPDADVTAGAGRPAQERGAVRETEILVVEDHPVAREELARLLSGWGYRVRVAGSVDEACASILATPPALLLTDYHLGAGTAMDIVDSLAGATASLPVIVLTADVEQKSRDINGRTVRVVHKPLAPARLRMAVDAALRREGAPAPG